MVTERENGFGREAVLGTGENSRMPETNSSSNLTVELGLAPILTLHSKSVLVDILFFL